ncbi:restriction endonuclease subunit S [Streptosporangium sp. NPDC000509]|uniref:restriction endonuclease subunit S n=1 Tax=Streptosporangium sp. NPDC000509 TaxID=3366186 RepID=UPI0036B9102D
MSEIDRLLAEHCPDGVEVKMLGEIGTFIRGRRFTKADMVKKGIPCIHYGEIYTEYGVSTESTISHVREDLRNQLRYAQPGDVIVAGVGETVEDVGKAVAWLGEGEVAFHDDSFLFRSELDPTYVSYYFQTSTFRTEKEQHVSRAKMKRLSSSGLSRITIPVPPPEVQCEIVRILDNMTELRAELRAELQAELQARTRQYGHYRDLMLRLPASGKSWPKVKLREVADIRVGFAFKSKEFSEDPAAIRLIRGDNIGQGRLKHKGYKRWLRNENDALDPFLLREGDVVLAMDRPWIPAGLKWAQIKEGDVPALLVQRVARMRAHSAQVDERFLGRLIDSPNFTEYVLSVQTGNTVPHLSGAQIGNYEFRLPSRAEQVHLAERLEAFDALMNDLSTGLHAEIDARRNQYEHYRDKLLKFEKRVA